MRLGGAPDRPAIVWNHRTITYAELADAVGRWPVKELHDASALDLPEALTCVFAAARQGAAVAVENPDLRPARPPSPLPDAFLLVATSGSSGRPKALTRTAASWTDSFPEFTSITGLIADDRVLITGPLHATMHLFGAVHALWLGACITDDASTATAVHAVPAVLRSLDAPQLRTAVVAGIALDEGAIRSKADVTVIEYYGAAELSLVAVRVVPRPLTLLTGVEAETRDGLLFVRSPYAVLNMPEWVGVGDLATVKGREVIVHGRGDAAINVGGTTVVAEDVERILGELDGVRAVAVVGTSHGILGETVAAAIELNEGAALDTIRALARTQLTKEALPRRWTVVEELPRTPSGKIARALVRGLL